MEENFSAVNSMVIQTGTATGGPFGPPIGQVDIGVSEKAYLFRVVLPGVRKDDCGLSCEIERDGKVQIGGVVGIGELRKRNPEKVFKMSAMQLSPPGPFTISFKLPGPVDPRLFAPTFRSDGILEAVVMKVQAESAPSVGQNPL